MCAGNKLDWIELKYNPTTQNTPDSHRYLFCPRTHHAYRNDHLIRIKKDHNTKCVYRCTVEQSPLYCTLYDNVQDPTTVAPLCIITGLTELQLCPVTLSVGWLRNRMTGATVSVWRRKPPMDFDKLFHRGIDSYADGDVTCSLRHLSRETLCLASRSGSVYREMIGPSRKLLDESAIRKRLQFRTSGTRMNDD